MTADWIPAKTGDALLDIDTPALVLDLDRFELNLGRLMEVAKAAGVRVRPHAKTHKSPVIARLQMARGAVGQCVQKVAEAEALAWGGIPDILVSNEVVGASKLARLAALARIAKVAVSPTTRRRWRRSKRRRRMPACGCRCWWRSTSAPAAAACSPAPTRWRWRSASPARST